MERHTPTSIPNPEQQASTHERVAPLPPGTVEVDPESIEFQDLPTPQEVGIEPVASQPATNRRRKGAPIIAQLSTKHTQVDPQTGSEMADGQYWHIPGM